MYESFFKEIESSLKPALDVAEINRKAVEKLASVQSNCLSECIEASVKQFQALTTATDPQSAAELQIKFFQDFEAKLVNTAEQNVATLTEASEELKVIMDKSFEDLAKMSPVKLEEMFSSVNLEELSKLNPLADLLKTSAPAAAPVAKKPAAKKPAPAKKEAAQPAAKKAPVRRAAAKPAVKTEAKPAAPKAAAKKPAAKKAEPTKKPAAEPAVKAAAKPAAEAVQKPVKTKAAPAVAKAAPARAAAPKPAAKA
ncbi:MAG: phasin family protein [Motiliproteus sp.]|nr:phasin family protein [Motiliproteus sp.]MCW9053436.1 phasin family protein [Motiliproteus sp.]